MLSHSWNETTTNVPCLHPQLADLGRRNVIVTWAGFNSNLIKETTINPRAIVGVLPAFPDKAESVPMGKRMMNIGKNVT